MKNLFFNVEKKYGVQRKYTTIDNATSPKVVLVIGTIEAKQWGDILTANIPNIFVQTAGNQVDGIKKW